ncbi:MAG: ATP-dependent zinc metalloprotease FtsH [Culicoidibacterales bacterium]
MNTQSPKTPIKSKGPKGNIRNLIVVIIVCLVVGGYFIINSAGLTNFNINKQEEKNYSEFLSALQVNDIGEVTIKQTTDNKMMLKYKLKSNAEVEYIAQAPSGEPAVALIQEKVLENNFTLTYARETDNPIVGGIFQIMLFLVLPLLAFAYFFSRITKSQSQSGMQHTKSRAKLQKGKGMTYEQVAGYEEEKEELQEIVAFLKTPQKFQEMGARIPKGILLSGSPGTGKTLLARATAGEAGVNFFTISGSEFLELYVGVGASRVRDMFAQAQQNAPAIIFIDEIDAIGRQRGAGVGGGNDEREQTLNQILVEMDGFDQSKAVVVMAATNRPDVLDPALLRPGRFDRQVTVSLPDIKTRVAILTLVAKNKPVSKDVDLEAIARRTPGFSGAELENVLNEAALLSARDDKKEIGMSFIEEAIDRVMMGPAKKSKEYTAKERNLVAYHEAGHAVIGLVLEDASIVQKITIIPRGQAGGYNLMTPKEEEYFSTKKQLLDQIAGFLGGRVAEEIMFGDISSGAHNDIQNVTAIARAMVTEYGMSELGPIQYEQREGSVFLGRDMGKKQNFSEKTATNIDDVVRKMIEDQHQRVIKIMTENKNLLTAIANLLLDKETIVREEIEEVAKKYLPGPAESQL